ncbi:DNA-binding protein WhiA [Anaerotignum lactatifermentans]|uniref:Probable cell division protein WhiA n=1 Tax=Anaerotignum lactatifermentans TaxID=160404 RepID=A0ABS2G855_9FIRM|nr:DNA-binding protein WhiA [Anaerotignum lactatifermentans]MBM6828366.1 DNA-binding protein WhiA [Anaerotignum lactatifermentans]MBM6877646.1 DNA-binding protein WhiA [Anaerotignum lactatifermentans]MBM6949949.1 DNA-binding protein WhiA [Anaerotignum lactatifermentans]
MSFSYKVKEELSAHFGNARHCMIAELAAYINMCGQIVTFGDSFCLKIHTENFFVVKKCFTLLKNAFNIRVELSVRSGSRKKRSYLLLIRDSADAQRVLMAVGVLHRQRGESRLKNCIYPPVTASVCCRRAYVRGAFIAAGSVNNPEKNYHLEFVLSDAELAVQLKDLINSFELDAKMVERKDHSVVYLKEGEQIVDLFNVMEAHVALMDLENVRIVKEMRNDINRKVNCETANLNKVVGAAVKQLEDIAYIEQTIGLGQLPEQLEELARVRLEYPDKSLKELGTYLSEPVGKSGVNHRLRKISSIAESLREGKGEVE